MERITEVQSRIQKADRETDALEKELKKERGLLDAVSPYQELHFDISRILHFKEVRFRFGRLPVGYYERLKTYAYDDACTIFEKCKETEDYVWGVYFVPAAEAKKVDAIYASLHFERINLEDAYEGTVDEACRELKEKTDALEQQITAVRAELAKELNGMSESISVCLLNSALHFSDPFHGCIHIHVSHCRCFASIKRSDLCCSSCCMPGSLFI